MPDRECGIKWCHHDSFIHRHPYGGRLWIVHEAFCQLYQEMVRPREALSCAILREWHWSIRAHYPCYKAKERRVNQSFCGEISEYGASISKWHDTVYTGRDLPPHPSNHTPSSNRSNLKSHLEATSLIRWTSRRHNYKSKPERLQEHVALSLLGNELIRLFDCHVQQLPLNNLNHSIGIMLKTICLSHPHGIKKSPGSISCTTPNKKVLSMIKLISHLWSNKYS